MNFTFFELFTFSQGVGAFPKGRVTVAKGLMEHTDLGCTRLRNFADYVCGFSGIREFSEKVKKERRSLLIFRNHRKNEVFDSPRTFGAFAQIRAL